MFDALEVGLRDSCTKYTDNYTVLIGKTKAFAVAEDRLPRAQTNAGKLLLDECGVKNPKDRVILSEAIRLKYGKDCWTALVTNDMDDLLSNKEKINTATLLLGSDPLYAIPKLQERYRANLPLPRRPTESEQDISGLFESYQRPQ